MANSMKSQPLRVDAEFVPLLQWLSTLAWRLVLVGWVFFLLMLAMTQFEANVGPAGLQLADTFSEDGWLMFVLLTASSVVNGLLSFALTARSARPRTHQAPMVLDHEKGS